MKKDFWSNSKIAVLGGGSFGTVLANVAAQNSTQVTMYVRAEDQARAMNATRLNPNYSKELLLDPKIKAVSTYEKVFENHPDLIIFALPSSATREQAKIVAKFLKGSEVILHATKGIEEQSLKRISTVLAEELPTVRIGAISGPNLAGEIAKGEPAATVVASAFEDVIKAGEAVLSTNRFRVYTSHDIAGVEWGGTLKNIFAIASGILDSVGFGWNTRSLLLSRGLAEMVRFGVAMGAEAETFLGLSGMGDLIATCSSPASRNFRVGFALAKGQSLDVILRELGQVAEGVRTTRIVYEFAKERGVEMPITEVVYKIIEGQWNIEQGVAPLDDPADRAGRTRMNTIHENLIDLLGIEPVIVLTLSCALTLFIYKALMKSVNTSRHALMKRLFGELFRTYIVFAIFWTIQYLIQKQFQVLDKFFLYFGIATVILGAFVFIRAVKIFVFQYLFLNSQKVGVPVLLVNLVTLILSLFIAAWLSTSVFGVRWAPLLATSAIVSVVLGLALQDTLGNLFAGVALQFDKPYEIGDWVEVNTEDRMHQGEVFEITWRATVLYGFLDELVTLPNRLVAQSEVSNFSGRRRPIFRAISVYLDASADEVKVKEIFYQILKQTEGVLAVPSSLVMLRDLNEKGAHWRIAYPITHYSKQYRIVDEILMRAQAEFKKNGIPLARFRVETEQK